MYEFQTTSRFDKDLRNNVIKRGYDVSLLQKVIDLLLEGKPLPARNKDHALTGNWIGYRDCHVAPDWILIYRKDENNLILIATRTGTHSDLY